MSVEHRIHARCGCGFAHASREAAISASSARPFAFAGSPRNYERDRPFAIDHLALDAALDLDAKTLAGKATLSIHRVDPDATDIELDAIAFDLKIVTFNGKKADFVYDGRTLKVTVGPKEKKGTIVVEYVVTPRRGLYFLAPDEHVKDRPRQVWSQCQEEDARHFIPCHDKPHVKQTTEMKVRVPKGFYVLSNGELVSKDTPKSGAWTYHWKMNDPHPSYLLTLVAGEFAEITAQAGKTPLAYLVPKDRKKDGERTFERTPDMVNFFGEVTGVKFPWNKYAQVVVSDFIFGGMENTSATTMYEHILLDERAAIDLTSDDLIAHELAHQWFGDYVTCRDWSEGWLNEGFATYFEHVWRQHHLGQDEYELGLKGYATADHSVSFDAAAFQIDWKNIQLLDTDPVSQFTYFSNGSAARSRGIELAGTWIPWRGLSISPNFTYTDAVLTQDLPAPTSAVTPLAGLAGDELPYTSKYSGNLNVQQNFNLTDMWSVYVGANYSYVGDRLSAFRTNSPSAPRPRFDLPGYGLFDMQAGLSWNEVWRLNLYGRNLGDKRGVIAATNRNGTAQPVVNFTQPRTIGFDVEYNFKQQR